MTSWLRKFWRLLKQRLRKDADYCIECGSCGEHGCCPTEMCRGGMFCAGYYGPVRRGAVQALVQLRREADEYAQRMSPQLVKLQPGETYERKDCIHGWPMPEGFREETWDEYRNRVIGSRP